MSSPSGPSARRSWPQRLLISFNAVALVAAALAAGALAYSNDQISGIDRLALDKELQDADIAAGEPQNILVVGIDSAAGLDADDPAAERAAADFAGQHTDSIMVVRLDPQAGTIETLSFPRDLWVPIADTGIEERINYALPSGGPSRLIRTIAEDFDIPIQHYLQVDFAGFGDLIDVVDGVPVQFPHPVRSRARNDLGEYQAVTEIDIPTAGCWTLGPRQALAFSRDRKGYQVQDADGDWHTAPGGDFSRIERQQLLIRLAMQRAISNGARNPNVLRRFVEAGFAIVTPDDSLSPGDLVELGLAYRDFDPAGLRSYALPVTDGRVGGADVLYLQEDEAEATLAVFRGTTAEVSLAPADVEVQVRNGSGAGGQGGEVTDELSAAGFSTALPTDADTLGEPTRVRYLAGGEAKAQLVARHVLGPVDYVQVDALDGADVEVVTGSDWLGVAPTPRASEEVPGPTTTTTTAPSQTGTPDPTATTVAGGPVTPGEVEGDVDDPAEDAFYQPQVPAPGAECQPTS